MNQPKGRKLIAVTGATGNIGRVVVDQLLKKGQHVRAIGRTPAKLSALKARGAETFAGSMEDVAVMTKAFEGATSVFMLIPPNMTAPDLRAYYNKVGEALAKAAAQQGVQHVVSISSHGAHLKEGTGPILGLHDQEERLNQLSIPVIHLRPPHFMENHLQAIRTIQENGFYANPMSGDHPFPQIATRDIGLFAADFLAAGPTTSEKMVIELFGPRDYSMIESAKILGSAVGQTNLKYVQVPYDDARKAMLRMGLSVSAADALIEMTRSFNEGKVAPTQKPGPGNTGKITLEQFAQTVFKNAYGGQPVGAVR